MAQTDTSSEKITDVLAWLAEDGVHQHRETDEFAELRNDVATEVGGVHAHAEYVRHALLGGQGHAKPFLLRPIGKQTLPVLAFSGNLATDPPTLRLRVVLYYPGVRDSDEPPLLSVGYRFETPEGSDGDDHHMHHMQPIRSMSKARPQPLPGLWEHTPDRDPTLPLAASSPLGLLLCMVVSLYGKKFVRRTLDEAVGGGLKPFLQAMT